MAMHSHRKAAAAQANGWFTDEIVPIQTVLRDKDGNEASILVSWTVSLISRVLDITAFR